MTVSIPQIQNKILYNINPNINSNDLFGQSILKYNPYLFKQQLHSLYDDLKLYGDKQILKNSILKYQQYFNKTIYKQAQELIPQRCIFKKGVVYGNNDISPPLFVQQQQINVNENSILSTILVPTNIQSINEDIQSTLRFNNMIIQVTTPDLNIEIIDNANIYNIYKTDDD